MPASLKSRLPAYIAALNPQVNEGMGKGAELVAERAKDRVPVESGDLRDAIHVDDASALGGGFSVVAGDTNAFYGHLVEFGTTHSPPEPFLVPALEEAQDEVLEMVSDALGGFF